MSFERQWGTSLDRAATELDEELRVVVQGRVRCCVALKASFYIADGHTQAVRERIAYVFAHYRAATAAVLTWGKDPKYESLKLRPLTGAGTWILDVAGWLPRLSSHESFEPYFSGGTSKDDASPYHFSALAETNLPHELSSVTFSLPLSWAANHPQGSYLALVKSAAELLQPRHGYAGLAVVPAPGVRGTSHEMEQIVPIVKRFRGVDLDFAFLHSAFLHGGIKGANWLTILGSAWVEKLGGRAGLPAALGPNILIHDYAEGLVLQAGPHPSFGDVNRNESMPHYERVAKVVRPIRVTDLGAISSRHGFNRDQTTEWLARFDEEEQP